MDQAPLQEVDVKSSLETTLIIMHHKLKRGILVTREFAPDLPKVMAYGSELNQVWTNLIDNAIDAMKEKGKLLVRAVRENEYVLVEIADDGPGIPPEVQSRKHILIFAHGTHEELTFFFHGIGGVVDK